MTQKRNTRQRELLWRILDSVGRPVSIPELHELALRELPTLGIATVYRTIRLLLDEGQIKEVEVPGFANRYERADLPHHHHFHCDDCDKVFDMEGCVGAVARLAPEGFQVRDHHILLSGTCPDCGRRVD